MLFCHLVVYFGPGQIYYLLRPFFFFSRNCHKQTGLTASNTSAAQNIKTVSFPVVSLVFLVPQWIFVFCRMAQLTPTSVCVPQQLLYPRCSASISSFCVFGDCWRGNEKNSTKRSCSAQDKHGKASLPIFTCSLLCADGFF